MSYRADDASGVLLKMLLDSAAVGILIILGNCQVRSLLGTIRSGVCLASQQQQCVAVHCCFVVGTFLRGFDHTGEPVACAFALV
jgi:hypothetical protein